MTVEILTAGVYDISAEDYNADPVPGGSLSSSGARKLLPPSCPALFRYWVDHGQPPKADFDWGHAAHREVLGAGPETVIIDAADWRTKAAKEQRAEAYAAGKVPMLRHEYWQVREMASALRSHPIAAALLSDGTPEQSAFWVDEPTGVWRRARFDWLRNPSAGRLLLVDYKTTDCAAPSAMERALFNYGYYMQAAWYLDAVAALGLADDAAFLFVAQEKTPPYLVSVIEPDATALQIGRARNRHAIERFRDCTAAGIWPSYSQDVELVGLPRWAENRFLEEYA